ncbi:MAG: ABC transporter permease [Acidobacteria bacterium]|nr:ABC transporter permease [Acidobacteriota bacterium]
MNLRRAGAVSRKEFLHILRDPRSLLMALALPLLMIVLFGYALSLDVDRIPTIVYDMDHTAESRELVEQFGASRFFEIVEWAEDYSAIERAIDRDMCLMGIIVPPAYSRDLRSGKESRVQLILDGSDSNTASIARGYSTVVMLAYNLKLLSQIQNRRAGFTLSAPFQGQLRVWYNSELKSKNYVVPGLIALILMIISALLTSLTIAREWEMGSMEQLLSTPLRPAELILGKMSAFFALGAIDTLLAVVAGVGVFKVPLRGSLLFLALTSCVFLIGALCWGILISALARSQLVAFQLGMLSSFLPAFLLSGFVFAIENMPAVIQLVTYVFPVRYFVSILKGVFLKGVGWHVLWLEVVLLAVYGAVVFMIAVRKLRLKVA